MLIASVLIGGVEMIQPAVAAGAPAVLLRGFSISRDISQRTGRATFIIMARPADLIVAPGSGGALFGETEFGATIFGGSTSTSTSLLLPGATVEIWDGAGSGTTGSLFGQPTFGAPLFGGSTAGTKRFAGTVSKITPRAVKLVENGLGYTEYTLECQDYTALLDTAVLTPITLPASSDQTMIRYIVNNTLPDIDTADVDSIASLDALALNGVTARQALESIAALSGGNFWIDENKALQYHAPTTVPAPFGIKDVPDLTTTVSALYDGFQYSEDWTIPGNRITVIGGGDTPPTVTVDDSSSQSQYGRVFTRVFTDTSLKTSAAVTARANVELARYKLPQKMGRFTTEYEGLDVGQLLSVTIQALGISGSFLIRRVAMTWDPQRGSSWTRFSVEFGDWNPDLIRFLRALAALTAPQATYNSTVVEYNADDTITVPPNVTTMAVECWGPGGAGGNAVGGGGGGGAYARSDVPVTPGTVLTITVPASGAPTWFASAVTIAADYGRDGTGVFGVGGQGGQASASVGSTVTSGSDGSDSGGGAGGNGGGAANGGGAGGAGCPAGPSHAGSPGAAPGGGGGGGGNTDGGGSGAPGRVKLTFSVG